MLQSEIQSARELLPNVTLPDEIAAIGLKLVEHLKIDSLRAEITLFESARAYAAADARSEVTRSDLREIAALALRARRSSFMTEFFASQQVEENEIQAIIDNVLPKPAKSEE